MNTTPSPSLAQHDAPALSPTPPPRGRYACEACVTFYSAHGMCEHCPDEPLVDTHDEAAMEFIKHRSQGRAFARRAKLVIVGILIAVPLHALLLYFAVPMLMDPGSIVMNIGRRAGGYLVVFLGFLEVMFFSFTVLFIEEALFKRFPTRDVHQEITATPDDLLGATKRTWLKKASDFVQILGDMRRPG